MIDPVAPGQADRSSRRFLDVGSLDDLAVAFSREIGAFGLTHFALARLPRPPACSEILISNWPPLWWQRYAVDGYAAEDIGVEEARRSPVPFTWSEIKRRRPGEAPRMLATAAELGWHDGFIVPVHGPDGLRGIVASMGPLVRFGPSGARSRAVAMALDAYGRAEHLYDARQKPSRLSNRERDALRQVAQGMDDAAIGMALGVTRTTAHAYVERAKKRLGASTRAQAVARALTNRLI